MGYAIMSTLNKNITLKFKYLTIILFILSCLSFSVATYALDWKFWQSATHTEAEEDPIQENTKDPAQYVEPEDFFEWLKTVSRENTRGAVFLPNRSIKCNTREKFVKLWNRLVQNNGSWTESLVKQAYNCSLLYGSKIGRIVVYEPDTQMVEVEYGITIRYPDSEPQKVKKKAWTHLNIISTLEEYYANQIQ